MATPSMNGNLGSNDQVFGELAKILRQLAQAGAPPDGLGPAQIALLAYHVAHALRVAASPSGGVQASVEYLQLAAASHAATSNSSPEPTASRTTAPQ
jgi:hypothetical protein